MYVLLWSSIANRGTLSPIHQTLTFDITLFEPFVPGIVPQLLSLVSELDTLGGKRRVIGCLIAVIERSETRVRKNLEIAAEAN